MYKQIRKNAKAMIDQAYRNYIKEMEGNIKSTANPRFNRFWISWSPVLPNFFLGARQTALLHTLLCIQRNYYKETAPANNSTEVRHILQACNTTTFYQQEATGAYYLLRRTTKVTYAFLVSTIHHSNITAT
jgi:hypothetical protein